MDCYNILTQEESNIDNVVVTVGPEDFRFIYMAPHSGLDIPKYVIPFLDKSYDVLGEMFRDGDPWTDLFDLSEIGGLGIHTKIHRDVSDPNRSPYSDDFVRKLSFHGKPIFVKEIDNKTKGELREFSETYWDSTERQVSYFRQKNDSPLYLIFVHSMDPVAGDFYSDSGSSRPDISLIIGSDRRDATIKFSKSFYQQLSLKYNIKLNYPYKTGGYMSEIFAEKDVYPILIELNKNLFMPENKLDLGKLGSLREDLKKTIDSVI